MEDKDTLYARWLAGDLSIAEIEGLKASGEWEDLEAVIRATDGLSLPKMDIEDNYDQLLATRLRQGFSGQEGLKPKAKYQKIQNSKSNGQKSGKIRKLSYKWAIAASLSLAIGAWLFLRDTTMEVSASYASNISLRLQDNSSIVLNDGSSVSYIKRGWNTDRIVRLAGRYLLYHQFDFHT